MNTLCIKMDKSMIPEIIDQQCKWDDGSDFIYTSEPVKKVLTKEKAGPNYFLVGGPYKNYV